MGFWKNIKRCFKGYLKITKKSMFTTCIKLDWLVPCMDCLNMKIKGLTNKNDSSIINIEHKDYYSWSDTCTNECN